ncbi:hypothetical protein CALCODRAFT_154437 [Calocera cornea HHB12733]|uniref:Uncharacterized protein n=1 Tax=Calocera cornea HHB12733 TaxID=1353952 RepID=A0A165CLJ2_9BASI|nr:hypothetical protein CALCODRAFT_154437 [Calocera cornea HHB12733]
MNLVAFCYRALPSPPLPRLTLTPSPPDLSCARRLPPTDQLYSIQPARTPGPVRNPPRHILPSPRRRAHRPRFHCALVPRSSRGRLRVCPSTRTYTPSCVPCSPCTRRIVDSWCEADEQHRPDCRGRLGSKADERASSPGCECFPLPLSSYSLLLPTHACQPLSLPSPSPSSSPHPRTPAHPAPQKPAPKPSKPIPIGTAAQSLLNGPAGTKPHRRPARSEDGRYLRSEEEERRGRSRDVRPLR